MARARNASHIFLSLPPFFRGATPAALPKPGDELYGSVPGPEPALVTPAKHDMGLTEPVRYPRRRTTSAPMPLGP